MIKRPILLMLIAVLLWPFGSVADEVTDQFNFAEALFIQRDFESAIEEYLALLELKKDGKHADTARFRIGECWYRLGKYDKSVTAFDAALKAAPDAEDVPLANYNLAKSHAQLGNIDEAESAFAAAAKGEGEVREESMVGRAECLIKLERHADCATLYSKFSEEFPKSTHLPNVLFSHAWVEAQQEKHKEAAALYQRLIAEYPEHDSIAKAKLALSDSLTALNQFDEATKLLGSLTHDEGNAESALLRLAWAVYRSGDKEAAAGRFLDCAKRFPKSASAASALYNAGITHFELSKPAEARKLFEQLAADYPQAKESRESPFWRGLCLFDEKNHAEAVKLLSEIDAAGTAPEGRADTLLYTLGEAAAGAGDNERAVVAFQKLRDNYETSKYIENALYSRAAALQKLKRTDDAVADLQSLLADYPDTTLKNQALFALGEFLYRQGKPTDALPHVEMLAGADKSPRVAYRLGWIYFDLQNWAKAQTTFSRLATTKNAFRAEAQFMAGQAAEQQQKPANAIAAYQKLIGLDETTDWTAKAFLRLAYLLPPAEQGENLKAYTARFPGGEYIGPITLKLAEASFDGGDTKAAADLYRQLLSGSDDVGVKASAHYGLAWCLLKEGDSAAAETHFAKVADGDLQTPIVQDAVLQRGEIAYTAERFVDAAAHFRKLVDAKAGRVDRALYMLAWSQLKLERSKESAELFGRLLAEHADSALIPDASMRLAELQVAAGDPAAARKALQSVLDKLQDPAREDAEHLYGDVLVAEKDWKALIAFSDKQLEKRGESKRKYLIHFRLGLAAKAVGLVDRAEAEFKQTIALTQTIEAAKAQFNLGALQHQQKNYTAAAKQFLRVEMLYDYEDLAPKSLYHAVEAFQQAGPDSSRRMALYQKKLAEKYPQSEWNKKAQQLKPTATEGDK
jgi:TolA-binding protein